jgi:hypothetical protein
MDQWNGQQRAFAIKMFQFLLGFSKVPVFLCHPVYQSLGGQQKVMQGE